MRARDRFTWAAVCAALWAFGCGRAELTPSAPEPRRAVFSLAPAELPAGEVGAADAVVFLPLVNRTAHRIHPSWVRAFDRALAAHAAVLGGRPVIDPEPAGVLATALGFPAPETPGSDFAPDSTALARTMRDAGAATLVWGELRADQSVALHAIGSRTAPWDGLVVALPGTRDVAYYEGPRRLLEALVGGPLSQEAPPAEAETALEAALAATATLEPATLRRSEIALGRLAAAHPRWARPWIELVWVRELRLLAQNSRFGDYVMDGPSVARHVARLFELAPAEAARLDALDRPFVWSSCPRARAGEAAAALVPDAWERLLLTRAEGVPPETFGLSALTPRTRDEQLLVETVAATDLDTQWRALDAIASGLDQAAVLRSPHLLAQLHQRAASDSDWASERMLSRIRALYEARGVLELLRGECTSLPAAQRAECTAPLAAALGAAGIALAGDLADDAIWSGALDRWFDASIGRTEGSPLVTVPKDAPFREDPLFATEYAVPAELVITTNAVLAAARTARSGLADPAHLLAAPTQARIDAGFDRLLEALHLPAIIEARRGDHAAAQRYARWGARFEGFPVVRVQQAWIGEQNNQLEKAAAAYEALAKADPYDARWAASWLHYVDYREGISWDDSSSAREAEWLETLVPRTLFITMRIGQAWYDAERSDRALAAFQELEALVGGPHDRNEQDRYLEALGRSRSERIAHLAAERNPYDTGLAQQLIELQIADRRYAEAELGVRALLEQPSHLNWACWVLVKLSGLQGRAETGGALLADCASRLTNRFEATQLWAQYGDGLVDRDRFEEAAAAYQAGYALVGGQGSVMQGFARIAEYTGHLDEAQRQYEWLRDTYGKEVSASSGRWELWTLHLVRDDPRSARAEVEKHTLHGYGDNLAWDRLRRTYQLEGNLAAFEELARGREGSGPAFALAQLRRKQGKSDEALALLERVTAAFPKAPFWWGHQAEVLIDTGRAAEAVPLARRAHEGEPKSDWSFRVYVDALIAAGQLDEAERAARAFADANGDYWWPNVLPLARVELARGHRDRARAIMDRARAQLWWGASPWNAEVEWLPFEVSLGLPARGSAELASLESRLRRALVRNPLEAELWRCLAEVRKHAGDVPGAAEAQARFARLDDAVPMPAPVADARH